MLRLAAGKLREKKDRIKALKKEKEGLIKQIPAAASPRKLASNRSFKPRARSSPHSKA